MPGSRLAVRGEPRPRPTDHCSNHTDEADEGDQALLSAFFIRMWKYKSPLYELGFRLQNEPEAFGSLRAHVETLLPALPLMSTRLQPPRG